MSLFPDSFKTKFNKTLSRLQIEKNKKVNPVNQKKWLIYKLTDIIKNEKVLNHRYINFNYYKECSSMRKTMQIFDQTQKNKKKLATKLSKENKLFREKYFSENNSRNSTISNKTMSKISKTISNFRTNIKSDLFSKNPLLLNTKKEYDNYYHSLYAKNNYNKEENEESLKYSFKLLNVLNEDSIYDKMVSQLNKKKGKMKQQSIKTLTKENVKKKSKPKNLISLSKNKNNYLDKCQTPKKVNFISKVLNKNEKNNTFPVRKNSDEYKEEAENIFDELIKNETNSSQMEDISKFKKRKSTKFYFDVCNANKYVKLENIYNDFVNVKNKINDYNSQKEPKLKLLYYLYSKNRKNPFEKQEIKDDKLKHMDLNLLLAIHDFK